MSSSSSYVDNIEALDSLSQSIPIVHQLWQILQIAYCIATELMNENPCWSDNIGVSI